MLKLNETPVRTCEHFKINNIILENVTIPEKIEEFKNIEITNKSTKININSDTSRVKLAYGLSDFLTEQINNNSNVDINIDINSKTNNESKIEFKLDKNNLNLIDNIQITANENTKSNLIIKYESENSIEGYHNGMIKVNAKKESEINVIVVNLLNQTSTNFLAIENLIEDNAKVNFTIIDFGGKSSISNYYSNLVGKESKSNLKTIYIGKGNQILDLNYIDELRGTKSNANIEVQGVLKDNSKKNFKGTIDFKKGCKKAVGSENENCMLLSDTAKSLALPMLLCSEEDVEGAHSTSSGKIGEKELFYIMSRGFNLTEAMKLFVRANFNEILESIKNEELKNQILQEIDRRLD